MESRNLRATGALIAALAAARLALEFLSAQALGHPVPARGSPLEGPRREDIRLPEKGGVAAGE